MRIIEFSDTFYPIMDGVGNVVFQYATHLGWKGHECYVVAPETDTGWRGAWPFELVDYRGMRLPKLKSYEAGLPRMDLHYARRMEMIQADIVHAHSPFLSGREALTYARKRDVPVVASFHSKYYDDFLQITGNEKLAKLGTQRVVNFYEQCDEVWAVSESSAETLRSYGYKGPLRVMTNGMDIPEPEPEAVAEITERYGLGTLPVLLFVGQMNWKKNLDCVLEAAAGMERDFRLVFAGQGPHEKEIRRLAKQLGLEERTVFTGHLTDRRLLNALYARADLFLFPSLYDNAPMVLREAAAAGTPAVVVRGSSSAEVVRDRVNGYHCENDPADLRQVVEAALSDPAALAAAGAKAKETIPVPWDRLIDQVVDRYAELVQLHRSAPQE